MNEYGSAATSSSELTLTGLFNLQAPRRRTFPVFTLLALTAMIGINAVWSLTDDDPTLIGGWLAKAAPLFFWAFASAGTLAVVGVFNYRRTATAGERVWMGAVAWLLLAFLIGIGGTEWLRSALPLPPSTRLNDFADPLVWLLHRSFFLMAAVPVFICWRWLGIGSGTSAWRRLGDWNVTTRFVRPGAKKRSWRWHFIAWTLFPILPLTLFFHAQLDFALITSGRLFLFLVPIIVMAFYNSLAEELIFRGILLPAFADRIGVGKAVWAQAVLFGLLHFGSSPAPLGAVAVFLGTTFLGVYFGKSVVETGGIGWAVGAHLLADFTFFSAQYISV